MNVQSSTPAVTAQRPYRLSDALGGETTTPLDHPRVAARTTLHGSRDAAHAAMLDAIQGARTAVHAGSYIFKHEGRGAKLLEAMLDRAHDADPIRIDIIADREGSGLFPFTKNRRYFDSMRSDVVRVLRHEARLNPFRSPIYHPKELGVDLSHGFVGTMAFDGAEWHDTMAQVRGATVGQLRAEHTASWVSIGGAVGDHQRALLAQADALAQHEPPAATGARILANRPGIGHFGATNEILSRIEGATRRAWVQTPFLGSDAVADALSAAARRGVDARVLVTSASGTAIPGFPMMSRTYYRQFLQTDAPVDVFEQVGHFSHEKYYLVDDDVVVGSANATKRALHGDIEFVVSSNEPAFVDQVEQAWLRDARAGHQVLYGELESPGARLLSGPAGKVVRAALSTLA